MMGWTMLGDGDAVALARRYGLLILARIAWFYACTLQLGLFGSLLPWPRGLAQLGARWPFPILALVDLALCAAQVAVLVGAANIYRARGRVARPVSLDDLVLEGTRLRRPWWLVPVGMAATGIACLYLALWAFVMLGPMFDKTLSQGTLLEIMDEVGIWPAVIGLALGVVGFLCGQTSIQSSRRAVREGFGITMLEPQHWLTQRVHALAAKLDLPPPAVGIMNEMNAFAAGESRQKAMVVLGVPLINMLSAEELDAVIGHELGHIVTDDMRRMQFAEGYQSMFGWLTAFFASIASGLVSLFAKDRNAVLLTHNLGILGRRSVGAASELTVKGISRAREYYADAIGAAVTSRGAMVGALEKIHGVKTIPTEAENRFGYLMFRGGGMGQLFSTHPTLEQRRKALLSGSHLRRLPRKAA